MPKKMKSPLLKRWILIWVLVEKDPELVCKTNYSDIIYIYTIYPVIDAEVLKREEEAIKLDGLNVAQIKELREKSEKFAFQAEVNRMMKLIINSLYRNKEVRLLLSSFL